MDLVTENIVKDIAERQTDETDKKILLEVVDCLHEVNLLGYHATVCATTIREHWFAAKEPNKQKDDPSH